MFTLSGPTRSARIRLSPPHAARPNPGRPGPRGSGSLIPAGSELDLETVAQSCSHCAPISAEVKTSRLLGLSFNPYRLKHRYLFLRMSKEHVIPELRTGLKKSDADVHSTLDALADVDHAALAFRLVLCVCDPQPLAGYDFCYW
jgi:hypothetical protein